MLKIHVDAVTQREIGQVDPRAEDFLNRRFPRREIRRVLLINPPDADASLFRSDTALRGRYMNYPPYGLAVLAENLRSIGIEARVCNLNHEVLKRCADSPDPEEFRFDAAWQSKLDNDVKDFQPDLIGVTCMFTITHASFRSVCAYVTGLGIPLAIGGVHVTNDVERVLDDVHQANFAFVREADVTVVNFVQVVNRRLGTDSLAQVIFNDKESGLRLRFLNEAIPLSEDLDVIPAFDLLDIPEYASYGTIGAFYFFKPPGTRFATVLSNRGCRARCTFCSVPNFNGVGVRQRSVTSVVDEIEVLQNEYDVSHFMWLDDDLLRDHKRAIEMFNEMVRRGLSLTWDATNGLISASCTEEVIAAAAESGCIALNIGMESGNPNILRQIRKPGTVETFLRAAEVLRKFDQIHCSVLLMVGFPGETMSMIFDTINVAREMDLDWHRISPLQPLPNTPIYDSMVAQGLIQDVGSKDLRFMGGAYGKQTEIERGQHPSSPNFEEAFSSIPMSAIPNSEQITDIWFYMNYHLNFHRLFTENQSVKIKQQLENLRALSDIISPENGFALYFQGYLQHKMFERVESDIVDRLRVRLASSAYWENRFRAFGLSIEDLINGDFKNKAIPRLMPKGLPATG